MLYDDICTGLEALGGVRQPRRNRYTIYKLPEAFYFVGKDGELLTGPRAVIAGTVKCVWWDRSHILNAAKERHQCPLTL
jgi:hypothetical protein